MRSDAYSTVGKQEFLSQRWVDVTDLHSIVWTEEEEQEIKSDLIARHEVLADGGGDVDVSRDIPNPSPRRMYRVERVPNIRRDLLELVNQPTANLLALHPLLYVDTVLRNMGHGLVELGILTQKILASNHSAIRAEAGKVAVESSEGADDAHFDTIERRRRRRIRFQIVFRNPI